MNRLTGFLTRVRRTFSRRRFESEIAEEMRHHIEAETERRIAIGEDPATAFRCAAAEFGSVDARTEEVRDNRLGATLDTALSDVRFSIRQLSKSPGFTAIAVLTLALGIGANTAIFTVMDQLLSRPLPVATPEQLVLLGQVRGEHDVDFEFNFPLFRDYQRENTVFNQMSATAALSIGLGTDGATEPQLAQLVSKNYFTLLGIEAAFGRTFTPDEGEGVKDEAVVILSYKLWQNRFGANPQIVGDSVNINSVPFTVIGVAPRAFTGTTRGSAPDLYVPITAHEQLTNIRDQTAQPLNSRAFTWISMMGRLKEGVTREEAEIAMNVLAQHIAIDAPMNTETNLVVLAGAQGFTGELEDTRLPLNLLFGIAGLVLLITCANLANIQLGRAMCRGKEIAIRLALGATRGRVIRGLLTESLILALAGGTAGTLVAIWFVSVIERFLPMGANVDLNHGPDLRVLLFSFSVVVGTGVLSGLAPAWRSSRIRVVPELKSGTGMTGTGGRRWTLRNALVVTQIALSLVVLVSAGLCIRSLHKLQTIEPAFEPSQIALMSFDLGLNNYAEPRARAFYDQFLERVRTLPGVEAAGLSRVTPMSGRNPKMSLSRVEGFESGTGPGSHPFGEYNIVSEDYFRTLGMRVMAGRDFTSADNAMGAPVVIVSDAFAQRYWSGQNPLGKRIFQHGPDGGIATEVVGVVETIRNGQPSDISRPGIFFPISQKPQLALTLSMRTGLDPTIAFTQLRSLVKSIDNNVPAFEVHTLAQQKDGVLSLQRMVASLLTGFAALALLLAALGIYGVLAYSVSSRSREIGIRMAVGAQVTDVLSLVMRQGFGLTLTGLLLGLAGALVVTRLLRSFLFGVSSSDPLTFVAVILMLAGVAALASWLPARRAAKVNPINTLRSE